MSVITVWRAYHVRLCYQTELLDEFSDAQNDVAGISAQAIVDRNAIGMKNAAFTWAASDADNSTSTPSRRTFRLLIEGELTFKSGSINLVLGPTGSGKTSLLMALLRKYTMLLGVELLPEMRAQARCIIYPSALTRMSIFHDQEVLRMLRRSLGFRMRLSRCAVSQTVCSAS